MNGLSAPSHAFANIFDGVFWVRRAPALISFFEISTATGSSAAPNFTLPQALWNYLVGSYLLHPTRWFKSRPCVKSPAFLAGFMPNLYAEDFTTILRQASHAKERLVLAVGPAGSGKTAWLRTVASTQSLDYVPVGAVLAVALANLSPRQRPLALTRTLTGLLPSGDAGFCLDNLDLLFLPELQCNPLRLVAQLSQHRLVIAAFTGNFIGGRYTRAYPDHPEYLSIELSGVTVASFAAGIPTFFQT